MASIGRAGDLAAIALQGVTAGHARGPVLDLVSLSVSAGEFVAVAGRSGSGKTTLLRAIAGLLPPAAGTIRVLGGTPAEARRAKRLGLVAQDARLHPWLTVLGNVRLPLQVDRGARRDARSSSPPWSPSGRCCPRKRALAVGARGSPRRRHRRDRARRGPRGVDRRHAIDDRAFREIRAAH